MVIKLSVLVPGDSGPKHLCLAGTLGAGRGAEDSVAWFFVYVARSDEFSEWFESILKGHINIISVAGSFRKDECWILFAN